MFSVHDPLPGSVFSLGTQAFTRAGAYFGVAVRPFRHAKMQDMGRWGTGDVFLITGRGGAAGMPGGNLCMRFLPVRHGVRIPFAVQGGPTELKLLTAYGDVRFCFAEPGLLLISGENGLSLRLETDLDIHRIFRKREGQSWECAYSACCSFVYTPVTGTLALSAPYDVDRLSTPQVRGELTPDAKGEFLLAVEEFRELGYVRKSYPGYAEGLRAATADWEACLAALPAIPGFAAGRERAAYQLWSLRTAPSGRARHAQIWHDFGHLADSFRACFAAAALRGDLPLAAELLLGQLDEQSPDGQVPAFFDDARGLTQTVAPPAQGWALEQLMRRHDLAKELPRETLEALYEGLANSVGWYDAFRGDGDGLARYEGEEECGTDGSPVFAAAQLAALPDLPAMLALLEEKLGDLAGMLGRSAEAEAWYAASRARIARMIERFWNGTRFVGYDGVTGAAIETESLLFYRPLLLGDRLPAEIVEAMAEDLSEGNGYLTPAGFVSQRTTSREFSPLRDGSGRIVAAENALIITGLYRAGREAEAKEAARRYCDALLHAPSAAWPAERGFPSSTTAAVFQLLAELAE